MGAVATKRVELSKDVAGEAFAYVGTKQRRSSILNDLFGDIGDRLCVHVCMVTRATDSARASEYGLCSLTGVLGKGVGPWAKGVCGGEGPLTLSGCFPKLSEQ